MALIRYFKLFTCCIPVKGYQNSIICDLQRSEFRTIENDLLEIFRQCETLSVEEIKAEYDTAQHGVIEAFFNELVQMELGFFTTSPDSFPPISMKWEHPSIITNAIIDFSGPIDTGVYEKTFTQLDALGCKALQLRFYKAVAFSLLEQLLTFLDESGLTSVELILPYSNENGDMAAAIRRRILNKYLIINHIFVYNAPKNNVDEDSRHSTIVFSTGSIPSERACGNISQQAFQLNIFNFVESHNFNSCLNRKISIDKKGLIRNCPSLPESYGHIENTSLAEVVKNPEFKKYWRITKDEIEVCRDCEFRYICTDCRAYRERPGDVYSKPLKCGYDPYTGTWENWSSHPLKQKAIAFYGMEGMMNKEGIS